MWMPARNTATFTPHGRRGRGLDRPGAVHRRQARLPESGRRHLLALRPAGDPRGGGGRRQHHLQDPLQRRGGDDRRPAGRRPLTVAADHPAGRRPRAPSSVVVVTDEPDKYPLDAGFAAGRRRSATATSSTQVQRELRDIPGLTVLVYDQTCAAEKRRRRKRGTYPDPPKRVFINDAVCEGCGDCSEQSNCVSVKPLETEFGRKRTIDQSQLQQGFLLPQGLLPELRHRAWRQRCARPSAARRASSSDPLARICRCRTPRAARPSPTASSSPASAAPASSPSARSSAWRRISRARAAPCSTSPASRRRTAR